MSKDGIYVCAELGVNWEGNKELLFNWADRLLRQTVVDAVKVQVFNEDNIKDYPDGLRKTLTPMILDSEQVQKMNDLCMGYGKDLVVTPMNMECIDWLKDIPIGGLKVRAKDWWKGEYRELDSKFPCPMYVSVPHKDGQVDRTDIPEGLDIGKAFFSIRGNKRYRIYCVPLYPPSTTDLHLGLADEFDGCSIHSPHWWDHFSAAVINIWRQWDKGTKRRFYVEAHCLPCFDWPLALDIDYAFLWPDYPVSIPIKDMLYLARACDAFEETIG